MAYTFTVPQDRVQACSRDGLLKIIQPEDTKMTLAFWGISVYHGLGTGVQHQEAAYSIPLWFFGRLLSATDNTSAIPLQQTLSLSLFLLHRQIVGHVLERGAKPCARATAQLDSSHAVPFQYRFCDMYSW
jgi:hypothetical protein